MNSKIFSHVVKKLHETWHLPRHTAVRESINKDSVLDNMPWTPARKEKFKSDLEQTFNFSIYLLGTVEDLVNQIDDRYLLWFFGCEWQPRTEDYEWSGWRIVEEINKTNPQCVLDAGCGYNPFKGHVPNLTGIDPYNNCADYMIDILEYNINPGKHDHILALGSINFNSRADIEKRFAKLVELLAPSGHLWVRANPGIDWEKGPWVEIFPWSFDVAHELAEKYSLELKTLKKDQDRLFLLFVKK